LLRYLLYMFLAYVVWRLLSGKRPTQRPDAPPQVLRHAPQAPHVVLGVAPDASPETVRAAYQRLIRQYHPDLVAEMGPEIRHVAEERTKELNRAYEALKQR